MSAKRRRAIERNAGRGTNGTLHGIEEEEKLQGGRETKRERKRKIKQRFAKHAIDRTYICVLHARGPTRARNYRRYVPVSR